MNGSSKGGEGKGEGEDEGECGRAETMTKGSCVRNREFLQNRS